MVAGSQAELVSCVVFALATWSVSVAAGQQDHHGVDYCTSALHVVGSR